MKIQRLRWLMITLVFFATVILNTVGTWSVTATDTARAYLTGTQSGIVVK